MRTYPLRRSAVGVNPRCGNVSKHACTPWFSEQASANLLPLEDLKNDSQESMESSFSLPEETLSVEDSVELSALVPVSTPEPVSMPVPVGKPVSVSKPMPVSRPARSVADTLKSLKEAYMKDNIKRDAEKKEDPEEIAVQKQEEPEPVKIKKRKTNEPCENAPERKKKQKKDTDVKAILASVSSKKVEPAPAEENPAGVKKQQKKPAGNRDKKPGNNKAGDKKTGVKKVKDVCRQKKREKPPLKMDRKNVCSREYHKELKEKLKTMKKD